MLLIARPLISDMFLLNFAEILQPKHSIFIAFQILRMIFILLIILLLSFKKNSLAICAIIDVSFFIRVLLKITPTFKLVFNLFPLYFSIV